VCAALQQLGVKWTFTKHRTMSADKLMETTSSRFHIKRTSSVPLVINLSVNRR